MFSRESRPSIALCQGRARQSGHNPPMSDDGPATKVESNRVQCTGDAAAPHAPVELVLAAKGVVQCPACGRRFRRSDAPDRFDPAVWPKGE